MNAKVAHLWPERPAKVQWPDEMSWISDLRAIDEVKAAMRERIKRATTSAELNKIGRYCEDVAVAFQVIGSAALGKETE